MRHVLIVLVLALSACATKPVVPTDITYEPAKITKASVVAGVMAALEDLGYVVANADATLGLVTTEWKNADGLASLFGDIPLRCTVSVRDEPPVARVRFQMKAGETDVSEVEGGPSKEALVEAIREKIGGTVNVRAE